MAYTQSEMDKLRNSVENMQLQEMFITGEKVDCRLMHSAMGSLSYSLYEMVDRLKSTSPDAPRFYEIAFDLNRKGEVDFLVHCFRRYARRPVRRGFAHAEFRP